jgi:hypothetical protein
MCWRIDVAVCSQEWCELMDDREKARYVKLLSVAVMIMFALLLFDERTSANLELNRLISLVKVELNLMLLVIIVIALIVVKRSH